MSDDTPTEEPTRHIVDGGKGPPKTGTLTIAKRAALGRRILDVDEDGHIEHADLDAVGRILRWVALPAIGLCVLLVIALLVILAYDFDLTIGGDGGWVQLSAQAGQSGEQP